MHTKIIFILQPDEDDYPPVSFEGVWAHDVGNNHYILDNIPFFARTATLGDMVAAIAVDAELHYSRTLVPSSNSLIRIVYYKETDPAEIRTALTQLGCATELDSTHRLIAVNVPPEVDLYQVQTFLHSGYAQDRWDYEEAILRQ